MKVLILPNIKKQQVKIGIIIYYFLRSLLLRGPFASLQLMLGEWKYEKYFGIISSNFVKSNSSEYFHYQGAAYTVLLRVFQFIQPLTKGYHFIDIGSGKGRALFVAEFCGYNLLSGVELSKELVNASLDNELRYIHKRKESRFDISCANALEYAYEGGPSVYFLFNPFNGDVLQQVIKRITSTTQDETWFIYMNPVYSEVFNKEGIKEYSVIKSGFYTEAIIYKVEKLS